MTKDTRATIGFLATAVLVTAAASCHDVSTFDACDVVSCGGDGVCVRGEDGQPTCQCGRGYESDGLSCVPTGSDGDADGDSDGDADGDRDRDTETDGDDSDEACQEVEICNGIDDDCDGVVDVDGEGLECRQGATEACDVSRCGTEGRRRCDESCRWIDRECTAAEETCNYCDDNGIDGIADERAMATNELELVIESCERDIELSPGASCVGSDGVLLIDGPSQVRGFELSTPVTMGYGDLEVRATVRSRCSESDSYPADGWAIVVHTDEGLFLGGGGHLLGVNRDRRGYAAEWRFHQGRVEQEPDYVGLRQLIGGGEGLFPTRGDGLPALDINQMSDLTQGMRMVITPDLPDSDGVNEMAVEAVRTTGGESLFGGCEGDECLTPIVPGTRLRFGVTASSGLGSADVNVVIGTDEGAFGVIAQERCEIP